MSRAGLDWWTVDRVGEAVDRLVRWVRGGRV